MKKKIIVIALTSLLFTSNVFADDNELDFEETVDGICGVKVGSVIDNDKDFEDGSIKFNDEAPTNDENYNTVMIYSNMPNNETKVKFTKFTTENLGSTPNAKIAVMKGASPSSSDAAYSENQEVQGLNFNNANKTQELKLYAKVGVNKTSVAKGKTAKVEAILDIKCG